MSWTQPICGACYARRYPEREPVRVKLEFTETHRCCDCGNKSREGIFFRVDPHTVPFPDEEEEA